MVATVDKQGTLLCEYENNVWTKPPATIRGHLCDKLVTIADRGCSRASHLQLRVTAKSDTRQYIFLQGSPGIVQAATDLFFGGPS